jgi:TonB family protein
MLRLVLIAALSCVALSSARSQEATPAAAAVAAASGLAPSARVQREASNPMRLIAEASKIRRKPGSAEARAAATPSRLVLREPSSGALGGVSAGSAAAIVETVTPLPPAPAEAAAAAVPPRIVSMVAPEFPAAVLREVGSFHEITVQITINRDGTVGDVSLPSATYRALQPYVIDALQRWRFEAPGEARTQRLQLVFNH